MSIEQTRELLLRSATLRARAQFEEAIGLIEQRLPDLPEHLRENALLEIIYASLEAGDRPKALTYARRLAEIDPDIPTVRRLLSSVKAAG